MANSGEVTLLRNYDCESCLLLKGAEECNDEYLLECVVYKLREFGPFWDCPMMDVKMKP